MANLAPNVELIEVKLATEHFEFCVIGFKPDVVYPVDAGNVYPLFGFQINHGTLRIRTQHTNWDCLLITLKKVLAASAEPWRFVV